MLSELDKTFSEKVTYAEQSVRRMKKVISCSLCTSACSYYAISSIGNPNFLSLDSSSDCTFQFHGFVTQDDKSFIIFRKSIGSFLECGSDDDFDLDDE